MKSESELVEDLIYLNEQKSFKLGGAESCTGGRVSAQIAQRSGVSKFFMGSVVAYENSVKHRLLHVSNNDLQLYGAVSEQVAKAMAKGAIQALSSDWSFSITGIAGPDGGTPQKPVGTVWFALVGPHYELTERKVFSGNRIEIQEQASAFALSLVTQALLKRK